MTSVRSFRRLAFAIIVGGARPIFGLAAVVAACKGEASPGLPASDAGGGIDSVVAGDGESGGDALDPCAAHATEEDCNADARCAGVLGAKHSRADSGASCWTDIEVGSVGRLPFVACFRAPSNRSPIGFTYGIKPGTTDCFSFPVLDTGPSLPTCESALPRCAGDLAPVPGDCGFRYTDKTCLYGTGCTNVGDESCYQECNRSNECKDPARPYCTLLGLYNGYDAYAKSVRVCRNKPLNDLE